MTLNEICAELEELQKNVQVMNKTNLEVLSAVQDKLARLTLQVAIAASQATRGGIKIEVNNGMSEQLEYYKNHLVVTHINEKGNEEKRDVFFDDAIIMGLNLMQYMLDHNIKSAFVSDGHEEEMRRYLNHVDDGNWLEFQIFQ